MLKVVSQLIHCGARLPIKSAELKAINSSEVQMSRKLVLAHQC